MTHADSVLSPSKHEARSAQILKIALDAGHGAQGKHAHSGAAANGLVEDEIALDMVKRIGHHLRAAGHSTISTRPGQGLVALSQRTRLAKAARCDLFVSIHLNAGPQAAQGVEAFVAEGDHTSRRIAEQLVKAISKLGLKSRGVKWDSNSQHSRLAVLRGTCRTMPAILLELAFLTNEHDAKLLSDRQWLDRVAAAIATALTHR